MVKGRKEDEGYGYLPEIDISVQGQDANAACRAIVMAAQGLGIGLDVGFMWRPKESAAYPGERRGSRSRRHRMRTRPRTAKRRHSYRQDRPLPVAPPAKALPWRIAC